MNGGIRLGRIFGINLSLDYSWFVIFALITFGLTLGVFPQLIPGFNITTYIVLGVVTSILFFVSVLLHELMHSLVAKYYGMNIEGIRLMIFGGVSQLTEEPKSASVEFKMAFAGPLTSIALGVIFFVVFSIGRQFDFGPLIIAPAFYLAYINVLLGVFNLLPGFPLDGGRVLRSAVWYFTGNLKRATGIAAAFGKGLSYLMMLTGIVGVITGNFNLIWFLLLGWYLLRAAEAGYQQIIIEEAMEGIKVDQAMTLNPETVSPDISIENMVKDHFMRHNWVAYPVVDNDNVQGLITINNIKDVPRRSWRRKRVKDVMTPLSSEIIAPPDMEISDALNKLNRKEGIRLLVVKGDHLMGIVTRLDIKRTLIKRLRLKAEEEIREEEKQEKRPAA